MVMMETEKPEEGVEEPESNIESPAENTENKEPPKKKKKKKRGPLWTLLRILIALVLIAVGTALILYIVALAAKYESVAAMLRSMLVELELMWQRIMR
jgi:flagellar basal body-associated protein FliL